MLWQWLGTLPKVRIMVLDTALWFLRWCSCTKIRCHLLILLRLISHLGKLGDDLIHSISLCVYIHDPCKLASTFLGVVRCTKWCHGLGTKWKSIWAASWFSFCPSTTVGSGPKWACYLCNLLYGMVHVFLLIWRCLSFVSFIDTVKFISHIPNRLCPTL